MVWPVRRRARTLGPERTVAGSSERLLLSGQQQSFTGEPSEPLGTARSCSDRSEPGDAERDRRRASVPLRTWWTQWNATGTGHHGSSSWFPRGIRGLAARAIMTANPMIRSSVRPRSQGDDLEHVSRTRKWTLCKQPARKGSALTRWRDGSGFTGAPCVRRPGDVRRERCGSRTRSAPLAGP